MFVNAVIPSVHFHLALWRNNLQAYFLHPRRVGDLLRPQPDWHEYGEVLRHCVPATVTQCLHSVSGKEGCGGCLDFGLHFGPAEKLDTGKDHIIF